jgi:hypothetical protein
MDQAAYLHLLRDRRARFHAALDEVGLSIDSDDDMRSVVGGEWTLGEHLVHIAAWERRTARTVTDGEPLPHPSPWQKFNDSVYEQWQGVEPDVARREYADAHVEFVSAVKSLPIEDDGYAGWHLGTMPGHYREHSTIVLLHAGRPKPPVWRGRIVE